MPTNAAIAAASELFLSFGGEGSPGEIAMAARHFDAFHAAQSAKERATLPQIDATQLVDLGD